MSYPPYIGGLEVKIATDWNVAEGSPIALLNDGQPYSLRMHPWDYVSFITHHSKKDFDFAIRELQRLTHERIDQIFSRSPAQKAFATNHKLK